MITKKFRENICCLFKLGMCNKYRKQPIKLITHKQLPRGDPQNSWSCNTRLISPKSDLKMTDISHKHLCGRQIPCSVANCADCLLNIIVTQIVPQGFHDCKYLGGTAYFRNNLIQTSFSSYLCQSIIYIIQFHFAQYFSHEQINMIQKPNF